MRQSLKTRSTFCLDQGLEIKSIFIIFEGPSSGKIKYRGSKLQRYKC